MIVAALLQADQADVVVQLERLVSMLTVIAVLIGLIGLGALGVSIAALINLRRRINALDIALAQLLPKVDTMLVSATRIARDAEDVSATARVRVNDLMNTVEDVNLRLRNGVIAVDQRVKEFGAVVDIVRDETEEILLDAASAARGVHTASEILRSGKRAPRLRDFDDDDDVFIEEE